MPLQRKKSSRDIRRVLLVFKASKLDRYRDDGSLFARQNDADQDVSYVYERLKGAHLEHESSLERAEAIFQSLGVEVVRATQPTKADVRKADLVVTLGGDGTFLWTARKVTDTPMLGVNTAPDASTGHYCGATVETLELTLDSILANELRPTSLPRLRFEINGTTAPYLALNDAFFSHRSPAASTRYLLRVGNEREMQVSSGIWVTTQSGSSGGISSAGGDVMDFGDERMQYRVMCPYEGLEGVCKLSHGYTDQHLKIVSRSPNNAVYLDGPTLSYRLDFGSILKIDIAPHPIAIYGYSERAC